MKPFTLCPTDADVIARMKESLVDVDMSAAICRDYRTTFMQIWMHWNDAEQLTEDVLKILETEKTRQWFEIKKHDFLQRAQISGKPFLIAMSESMQGRAEKIIEQIAPHISGNTARILDFGAGDGQIGELVRRRTKRIVEGFDVSPFTHATVSEPVIPYDGQHIPRFDHSYDDAIATNVLHHEAENQKCINELTRLTRHRLIIIETVPTGKSPEEIENDRWRTFMNDVMWNSILKKPETKIPIPGSYETPERWIERFQATRKWECRVSEDLGVDQKTIQDTHHLLVFDRK